MKEWMELQIISKENIRKYIFKEREKLSLEEKEKMDALIYTSVINTSIFANAKVVFIYVSFDNEVDTHRIIEYALSLGKKVCVPRVINRAYGMKALLISSLGELKLSKFGILEPKDSENSVSIEDIDLSIIPGLAFDKTGGRIGYGGGFYDRFFSLTGHKKIALAYEFQILQAIPREKHDILVDGLITEKDFIDFH